MVTENLGENWREITCTPFQMLHLNKLPIEYEWYGHLDNDGHILGLIKGWAGWPSV